jgi:hypothetical protein
MDKKYDATYQLGNTTVHIVAPPPLTEEEKAKRIREYYIAGWNAWNSLPVEERLRINAEYEKKEVQA